MQRTNYQKAYAGKGTAWTVANIPFTAGLRMAGKGNKWT